MGVELQLNFSVELLYANVSCKSVLTDIHVSDNLSPQIHHMPFKYGAMQTQRLLFQGQGLENNANAL